MVVRIWSMLLAVALVLPALPAAAHPVGPRDPYVVTVEGTDGRILPTFHHRGSTYVLGGNGGRYNVRIENRTSRRVEAVLSVDGRDAVSGRKGDYRSERGYVIDAWSEVVVEGFRTSHDDVAAFRFTDPSNSYSARMGTPENVGVIGVAFFPERAASTHRWWLRKRSDVARPQRRSYGSRSGGGSREGMLDMDAAPAAPSADVAEGEASSGAMRAPARKGRASRRSRDAYAQREERSVQNLGTEYGERLDSHVHEVGFRRASERRPAQLVTLYYDDREGLRARGIRVYRPRPIVRHTPDPFPGRFAPPPPR